VFLDPPYRLKEEYASTLELLADSEMVKPGTVIIAEHEKKFRLPDVGETLRSAQGGAQALQRLEKYRVLEQGDAALSFYRRLS